MLKDSSNGEKQTNSVSKWLANHKHFKSHSRHLSKDVLIKHGLKITALEEDKKLQDLSLSVFHATTHTFTGTNAVKIVENHKGAAFIKQVQVGQIQIAQPVMPALTPPE